jgi:hypothetical protein
MPEAKIHQAMSAVMAEIGAIGKNRKNTQQNYQFRGIDDIYNAAQSALIKHSVFCVPEVIATEREERQSKAGGTLIWSIALVKYTFFASDGSNVSAVVKGEAMDSGDKGMNKAMSAAQKYVFLQTFCIPTEEPKDTENETHEVIGKNATKPIFDDAPLVSKIQKAIKDSGGDKPKMDKIVEKMKQRLDSGDLSLESFNFLTGNK